MSARMFIPSYSAIVILCLHSFIWTVCAQNVPCASPAGTWYNELGSKMELRQSANGQLSGRYWTLVERENGSSGMQPADIVGIAPYNQHESVLGFSVMWRGGESTTIWTGQCLVCGGEEILKTSWLLKIRVDVCTDNWKSTLIGQNTFTRTEQVVSAKNNARRRRSPEGFANGDFSPLTQNDDGQQRCSLSGRWFNELGSDVNLTTANDNTINGSYSTAVERCTGAAGNGPSKVHGLTNSSRTDNTLAFFVVWNSGTSLTGWVGQCMPCGVNGSETLLTDWLLRSKVAACGDNWGAIYYGQNNFTRHQQNSVNETSPTEPCSSTEEGEQNRANQLTLQSLPLTLMVVALLY